MNSVISPTLSQTLFKGRVMLHAYGLPEEWVLADLSRRQLMNIGVAANELGVKWLLAPRPAEFNARICRSSELSEEIQVTDHISIWRGQMADGCDIPAGSAFAIASADCPTIIVSDYRTGMTVGAHAGLRSLVDFGRYHASPISPRRNGSVISAIMERFREVHVALDGLQVHIVCGVPEDRFIDPLRFDPCFEDAAWRRTLAYRELTRYQACSEPEPAQIAKVSLLAIIRTQLQSHGIPLVRISTTELNTYDERDESGQYRWWSFERGDIHQRNLVLVKRVH